MWDNDRLLNGIANGLFMVAGLILAYLAVIAAVNASAFPLRTVRVEGSLTHLTAEELRAALDGRIAGNFFGANLETVRTTLERLPWVRRVEVRREWPDRIAVRIEEHVPLARWADQRLVNIFGELFEGNTADALPKFGGPAGSEREVTDRYGAFRELVAPLGGELAQVSLSPRNAWQLRLSMPGDLGLVLELGREQPKSPIAERLARFVAVYPQATSIANRRIAHVDLRYPNGFALRIPELANERAEPARKRT